MSKKSSYKIITIGFIGATLIAATVLFAALTTSFVQETNARVNDGVGAEHASGNNCLALGDRCAFNNVGNGRWPLGGFPGAPGGTVSNCNAEDHGEVGPNGEIIIRGGCETEPVAPLPPMP